MRKQDTITDWNNGDMTLDYFSELEDAEINNEANEELLRMILEENHP